MTLNNYKNMFFIVFTSLLGHVFASAAVTESTFRDQYCTDPRTMKKHAAYSEWADAYSCTRHRCQPGGRNLAIYTVGCKRVEAPESAIECEEVVEDTNMQFPYCCTRLRCLVVVRGEVWTRVLGQPWETLPAAPWSHMYKMKKPPPGDTSFLPKIPDEGPVYELQTDTEGEKEKVLRSTKIAPTPSPDCNEVKPRSELRSVPAPDIVIALSTGIENKDHTKKSGNDFTGSNFGSSNTRQKRGKKHAPRSRIFEEDAAMDPATQPEDQDESTPDRPQAQETGSDEKYYSNAASVTQRAQLPSKSQVAWTEIPQNQWNEHEPSVDVEAAPKIMSLQDSIGSYNTPEPAEREPEKKGEKAGNLQALVDAIGTRMRDIESVVQRMSEKVHQAKTSKDPEASGEKRELTENEANKHRELKDRKAKKTNPDNEHYKRSLHVSSTIGGF
ncbi:uncharacterized protein LOC113234320 [Hyposmocoma kahamanoa]|uniref:uncharacterized protein LOC113234320 n=1 Tax=Hyposmocoma kahamanoa TaxID=1477025 RepID=UPI000E6DA532|nr:uncharacterized protein LOC113234320 [Hyposmocoma kahamanoa]